MKDADAILEKLQESPGDWRLRILAIEQAVRQGDMDEAKRFVREDPSGTAAPPEIQLRLHELLTKGPALFASEESEVEVTPAEEVCPGDEGPLIEVVPAETVGDLEKEVEPVSAETGTVTDSISREFGGGLGALVEDEHTHVTEARRPDLRKGAPEISWDETLDRWRNYDGNLNLVEADDGILPERPSETPDRISSFSLAVLAHFVIFFLVGLVAVTTPRPKPPQLVVSVVHELQTELVTPRITKPSPEIKPAAAAAQAIDVISSVEGSTFSIPDVDNTDAAMVLSMLPGYRPTGNGMDLSTEATKASDVNFFGISGTGRKIVFVIDATPLMLVDEKGGMTAYNNVKEEVGIMLANLNRATHFNILLYQGKRLISFREELVPGLPSNLRLAIEWLSPLNNDYESLGLTRNYGASLEVIDKEELPLQAVDVAHYTKAVQKAMEWQASAIFCIVSGYGGMTRSPTPEMLKKMAENPATPGTPGTIDPGEQKRWRDAVAKTREWLAEENAARREKGISPKVVVNFNQLVRDRTGASPPRRRGGTPGSSGMPPLPPIGPEDIEEHVKQLVKLEYKEPGLDEPSVHMVLFLGEDERIRDEEDHFRRLTRRNRGKLKVLRGLAALQDVTGK